jgi:hypothetical protein
VVGDLLVDNQSMHPWGATLWQVVEVVRSGEHVRHSPFGYRQDQPLPPMYRVLAFTATHPNGYERTVLGTTRVRVLQATKNEYLAAWNARRLARPMWNKEEWALYTALWARQGPGVWHGLSQKEAAEQVTMNALLRVGR